MREWLDHRFHLKAKIEKSDRASLTEWENKFLHASDCIEEALVAYERARNRSTMGLMFTWLFTVEDETKVAESRAKTRARNRKAVAASSDIRLKSNRIPTYPRPLELINIYNASVVLLANIIRDYKIYQSYDEQDPELKIEEGLEIHEFTKRDYQKRRILKYLACLKKRGYLLHPQDEDVLNWGDWALLNERTPKQSCRLFLSFLFFVDEKTIKKDLSRSVLRSLYKKKKVAKGFHHYLNQRKMPGAGTIMSSGWQDRLNDDGTPSMFDFGNTYYPMPYYEESNT